MMDKYNGTSSSDNAVMNMGVSDFLPFSCPSSQEICRPTFDSGASSGSKTEEYPYLKYQQNPRKKRTKLIKIDGYGVRSGAVSKPKYGKKPDPSAPKITKPCSECGKKFWSWKALFGHMRCHPERQWRGINPPPNFKHQQQQPPSLISETNTSSDFQVRMTMEDHEVATCLLKLANAPSASESPTVTTACNVMSQGMLESHPIVIRDPLFLGFRDAESDVVASSGVNCSRFECSSCKKVFGSRQALGGHRASHRNVKGCFAIHKNEDDEQDLMGDVRNDGELEGKDAGDDKNVMQTAYGHKCSICLRVFSSGQALGGHKRCHWEKGDDPSGITQALNPFAAKESWALDLNLPPVPVADDSSCSYSSGLALDLRLAL